MQTLRQYQIDAFADRPFSGNPAAVVSLERFLPDALMQQIAMENNQAETAFIAQDDQGLAIRWFTPLVEVELCGHATLASGFALFFLEGLKSSEVRFSSKSGMLRVLRRGDTLYLDFPRQQLSAARMAPQAAQALGMPPMEFFQGRFGLALYRTATELRTLKPDLAALAKEDVEAWICTAPGDDCDYALRLFGPRVGINEDQATGSAHCLLAPFWSERLNKETMRAQQLSSRGASFHVELLPERVLIGGQCQHFSTSEIRVPR